MSGEGRTAQKLIYKNTMLKSVYFQWKSDFGFFSFLKRNTRMLNKKGSRAENKTSFFELLFHSMVVRSFVILVRAIPKSLFLSIFFSII